jgi:hypothetical protein
MLAKIPCPEQYIKSLVELCGSIILLCIVSKYVEPLKPSNQMSNVKLLNLSVSWEFDMLIVLLVIFFSFSIF